MTVAFPDLSHRVPQHRWLTDRPSTLTAEWIAARYDEIERALDGAGNDAAKWVEVVWRHNELSSFVHSSVARVRLKFRQDTGDEAVAAEYRRVNAELVPVLEQRGFDFAQRLVAGPALSALEREFGEQLVRDLRTWVELHHPDNIPLSTREMDVLMGQTDIFAKLEVTWRGERRPWSFARKAAHDQDEGERRATFQSVIDEVQAHEDTLQSIFDEAGALRLEMARNLGVDSYPSLRYRAMGRYDYGPAEVASFRDAVHRHVVPIAHSLRKQQAAAHGAELVHPADQEIWPEPAPELKVPVDGQLDAAARVFDRLGESFAGPWEVLQRENLIDLPARPGKGAGGFCMGFAEERVPFIFCNSVDSPDDVKTLVHEFGHALQYYRSAKDIDLASLRNPSLEACEIHSMTLELLAAPFMDEFFAPEDADVYRMEHLRSTLLQVPYMAAVDEFQHGIYADLERVLDAPGRGRLWEQCARHYMPGIDYDVEPWWTQNRWLMQLHIFHYPFYYIDYALARMVSWELWLDSLEDAVSTHERYLALCSAGGKLTFRELLAEAGLGDPFDARTVERTMARLHGHLGL